MPPFVTQQPSGSGQAGVHFVGWLDVASRPPFFVPRCQTRVGRYKLVWWTLFLCTHALGSTLMPHKIKRDSPPVSTHARHPDPGSAFLCYTSSCRLCLSLSLSLALSLSPMTLSIAQRQKGMPTAFCHHSAPCGSYHLPQGAYRLGDEGLHAQRLYGPGPTGIADSSSSISSSSSWL